MANLFIRPFQREWQAPKAIQPEILFNDSEGALKLLRNRECVASSPTMGTSWPGALTHSPSPGPKKCGVISKGFLASKSKLVLSPSDGMRSRSSRARGLECLQAHSGKRSRTLPRGEAKHLKHQLKAVLFYRHSDEALDALLDAL